MQDSVRGRSAKTRGASRKILDASATRDYAASGNSELRNARRSQARSKSTLLVSPAQSSRMHRRQGASLVLLVVVIRRGAHLLVVLAGGAATAAEGLLELGAVRLQAHHTTVERLVRVRVRTNATAEPLSPAAVLRHFHLLRPADRAARAGIGRGLVLERGLALEVRTLDLIAGIDAAAGAGGVHRVLAEERGRGREKRKRKHRSGS